MIYQCEKCGGGMIVTGIRTDCIQLFCPHCKSKDQYPKYRKVSYTNNTNYLEKDQYPKYRKVSYTNNTTYLEKESKK